MTESARELEMTEPTLPFAEKVERADEGTRRAGLPTIAFYLSIPPALGFGSASWFLTDPSQAPWVIAAGLVATAAGFLLAGPLGRRSQHFAVAGYRRASELALLVGLTGVAAVAWTVGPYLALGIRQPWAREIPRALFGG